MRKKDKPPKREPKGDYSVGYAKTPEHSRFKPGNEFGKKGGRPKGSKNNATLLREILEFKIDMTLPSGITRRVTVLEAATWKTVTKALSGDARAYAEIKHLAEQVGIEITQPPIPDDDLTAEEATTLQHYKASIAAEALAKNAAERDQAANASVTPQADRPSVRTVVFPPRGQMS